MHAQERRGQGAGAAACRVRRQCGLSIALRGPQYYSNTRFNTSSRFDRAASNRPARRMHLGHRGEPAPFVQLCEAALEAAWAVLLREPRMKIGEPPLPPPTAAACLPPLAACCRHSPSCSVPATLPPCLPASQLSWERCWPAAWPTAPQRWCCYGCVTVGGGARQEQPGRSGRPQLPMPGASAARLMWSREQTQSRPPSPSRLWR